MWLDEFRKEKSLKRNHFFIRLIQSNFFTWFQLLLCFDFFDSLAVVTDINRRFSSWKERWEMRLSWRFNWVTNEGEWISFIRKSRRKIGKEIPIKHKFSAQCSPTASSLVLKNENTQFPILVEARWIFLISINFPIKFHLAERSLFFVPASIW